MYLAMCEVWVLPALEMMEYKWEGVDASCSCPTFRYSEKLGVANLPEKLVRTHSVGAF